MASARIAPRELFCAMAESTNCEFATDRATPAQRAAIKKGLGLLEDLVRSHRSSERRAT
jgi:hypothetical protein